MSTIITRLMVAALLAGGATTLAHESNLCGDGRYDPAVGQYTYSHPDGSGPGNLVISAGGTGALGDVTGLGGGNNWDWWITGGNTTPNGSPAFETFTWRKVKSGVYAGKLVGLTGTPTVLQPTDLFGVFPVINFHRMVITMKVYQSSDCSTVDVYATSACTYNTDTLADQNINTATPIFCADMSGGPAHLARGYKVAP